MAELTPTDLHAMAVRARKHGNHEDVAALLAEVARLQAQVPAPVPRVLGHGAAAQLRPVAAALAPGDLQYMLEVTIRD